MRETDSMSSDANTEHQHAHHDAGTTNTAPRLLPWTTDDGRPTYLVGSTNGPLWALADRMENAQVEMGHELLAHIEDLFTDDTATPEELRYVLTCMTESLTSVLRVAESRGRRLTRRDEAQEESDDTAESL
jgi:hypothetical protein